MDRRPQPARMNVRWAGENIDRMRMFAKELVDLQPDVIFSLTTPATAAVQRQTRTIPIVLVNCSQARSVFAARNARVT